MTKWGFLNDIVYEFISNKVEDHQFTTANYYSTSTSIHFGSTVGGSPIYAGDYSITFNQNDNNYFLNGKPRVNILSSYFNKISTGIQITSEYGEYTISAQYTRRGTIKIDDYVKQTILKGFSSNYFKVTNFTTEHLQDLFVYPESNNPFGGGGFGGGTPDYWMTEVVFTSLQAQNIKDMILYYGTCSETLVHYSKPYVQYGVFTIPDPTRGFDQIHNNGSMVMGSFSTARMYSDYVTNYYSIQSFTQKMTSIQSYLFNPYPRYKSFSQYCSLNKMTNTVNVYQSSEVVSNIGKQTVTYSVKNG